MAFCVDDLIRFADDLRSAAGLRATLELSQSRTPKDLDVLTIGGVRFYFYADGHGYDGWGRPGNPCVSDLTKPEARLFPDFGDEPSEMVKDRSSTAGTMSGEITGPDHAKRPTMAYKGLLPLSGADIPF